jgi:hypothetical protein
MAKHIIPYGTAGLAIAASLERIGAIRFQVLR